MPKNIKTDKKEDKKKKSPTEKLAAFKKALAEVSSIKNFSPVALMPEIIEDVEKITTGSLVLDSILGGGFPVGRLIEIYGENASGKTSIALTALGELQKNGGHGVFIDAEQAFDPFYARKLGVDTELLAITQSIIAEEVLTQVERLAQSGSVDMIIVDSVASIIPIAELEADLEKASVASRARLLSKALPKIVKAASENDCTVIFLNQTRTNVGVMYGDSTVTSGGKALAFAASQRIKVSKAAKPVEIDGEKIGTEVTFRCIKNKVAPPYGVGSTVLTFTNGFDKTAEALLIGEQYKVIEKTGRTYRYKTNKKIELSSEAPAVYEDENTIKLGASKAEALTSMRKNKELVSLINIDLGKAIHEALLSGKLQDGFAE